MISSTGNVIILENTCNTSLLINYAVANKLLDTARAQLFHFSYAQQSGTKLCQIWVPYVLIPLGGACEHFLSETSKQSEK